MAETRISSSAKKVEGEKEAAQREKVAATKAKAEADRKAASEKAAENREKARIAAERKAAAEREKKEAEEKAKAEAAAAAKRRSDTEDALKIGAAVVGAVATQAVSKSAKAGKGGIKNIIIIILVVAVIALLAIIFVPKYLSAGSEPTVIPEGEVLSEGIEEVVAPKRIEFTDAILGEAREKQELVVWEQDVQVDSQVTTALANLDIFRKTKVIHSYGTGVYTVNMAAITDAAIEVDDEACVVTVMIPRTCLQYITKDLEKTTFEETDRSILTIGDLTLTQEQQLALERSIEEAMRAELVNPECFADADESALAQVYETFQPLIAAVSDAYTLEIVFDGTTANEDLTKTA